MSKVILSGYILVPDADLAAIPAELTSHIELSRREAGCLVFEVSQDQEHPNRYNVYEEFCDRESFDMHQERMRNSTWGSVTQNVTRHYQVQDVE